MTTVEYLLHKVFTMHIHLLLRLIFGLFCSESLVTAAYPSCINLVQYHARECCIENLPCPSPTGKDATKITAKGTQPIFLTPTQPTIVSKRITNGVGVTTTVAVVDGGPITSHITPTLSRTPTSARNFRSSVSVLSAQLKGTVVPLVSAWIQIPEPTKAGVAIQAIQSALPKMDEFAHGLPNGEKIFNCGGVVRKESRENTTPIALQVQKLNCELLDVLGKLRIWNTTTDTKTLKLVSDGLKGDMANIAIDVDALVRQVGGDVENPSGTEREISITSTMTSLPPGAWIQTLTGQVTGAVAMSKTSSRSNGPTVVPIIVPVDGPVQIVSML